MQDEGVVRFGGGCQQHADVRSTLRGRIDWLRRCDGLAARRADGRL